MTPRRLRAGAPGAPADLTRAAAVPSRLPFRERAQARAGYRWRNSGSRPVTLLRTRWDTRRGAAVPAARSESGGVSITYAGVPEGLAYTLDFTEQQRERASGQGTRRQAAALRGRDLRSASRLPDADILIIGTSARQARRLPRTAAVILPVRVHFIVDTSSSAGELDARLSRRAREQHRSAARKHDWQLALTRDPAQFDFFYDRMYRPTMYARHGGRQRIEGRAAAHECLFRTGFLFILSDAGEPVGGCLCHWDKASGVLTLRLIGIMDGAAEHYASGAFKAVWYLLIRWAADNGVRQVDLQGTEAFLSKGTFQWKRRLGASVVLPPNHFGRKRLWLQVRRDTPAVRDFLAANPVLAESPDGCLEATYFHDGERPPRLDYSAGVARTRQLDLDEFLAAIRPGGPGPGSVPARTARA